ncbi:MAG: F0F1 ATP synthase subunit beta, partial [Mucilaginibacter sp.]
MPNIGKISQIIGPVVDVSFSDEGHLPKIYDALEITKDNGQKIILEVQQHLGEDRVRAIAMDSTDGLLRGMPVTDLEAAIKMPIGDDIKGRVFNVVGAAIDGLGNLDNSNGRPIHNVPPKFEDLSTESEVLFTGIKVIDLLEPYAKGGKIGLFGGAGVGERTREGNDLLREMIESGIIKYGEDFVHA